MRDDWVSVAQATERVQRDKVTIYRWVREGLIRTMRPGRTLWLNLPDLLRVDKEKVTRRKSA